MLSAIFFNFKALVSQRSAGYKNTAYALAEIIDNSFDANADTVQILLLEKRDHNNRKYIDEILICDNGDGMSKNDLQSCLQFGGGVNDDIEKIVNEKKKGRYGYGLPNASLSQCPCTNVYTWQKKDQFFSTYMDLKELEKTQSIAIPSIEQTELPEHYNPLKAVINNKSGTIVSWRNCDRLMNTRAETIINKSAELVGQIFRYMLSEGKKIELHSFEWNTQTNKYNGLAHVKVRANDPLFLMSDTVLAKYLFVEAFPTSSVNGHQHKYAKKYKQFSKNDKSCLPTNEQVQDHCYSFPFEWGGRLYNFDITTSVAKLDIQKPGIREGGSTKVGSFYGRKSSINFVRADREISSGSFGFYKMTEARNRWWTIEVKFNADADELLGVHNNKQGIEFTYTKEYDLSDEWEKHTATLQQARERLWYELTNKIELARKDAWKIILKNHKDWDLNNTSDPSKKNGGIPGIPGATGPTEDVVNDVDGKRESQFTNEEKSALLDRLKEKFPSINEKNIKVSINNFDNALSRGCVLYHSSDSNALWSITTVYDFLIILVNTNHEFYLKVIAPLRTLKMIGPLAAFELFVSSLAYEEVKHFQTDQFQKDTLEDFRSYVGLHLNRYMKKLCISEEDFVATSGNGNEESEQ